MLPFTHILSEKEDEVQKNIKTASPRGHLKTNYMYPHLWYYCEAP